MGKLKALLLVGTIAGLAAGAARAADLPPPPILEPAPIEPVEFGGWYLRGDVGVGVASKPDVKSTFSSTVPDLRRDQEDLGDAAFVGAGVGYQFNNWLRADVTGEYRTSQSISGTESYNLGYFNGIPGDRPFDRYNGNVQSSVVLANGYVDLGTWFGLTPFVGAGVGGSYNRVFGLTDTGFASVNGNGGGGFGYARNSGAFDLAYAAHAGISYAVSPNLKLELAYRYLNMGDVRSAPIICQNSPGGGCSNEVQKIGLQAQDIRLGMRWMFSDIAPVTPVYYPQPLPPPPLVRKY